MKLAFITPRYGADLTTGPEHACRLIAEHVSQRHDMDVLTTCARDSRTWKNASPRGSGPRARRPRAPLPCHGARARTVGSLARLGNRLLAEPHSATRSSSWCGARAVGQPGCSIT